MQRRGDGRHVAVIAAYQAEPNGRRRSSVPNLRASRPPASPVPALDAATPYFSRLSARSALFTELHLLFDGENEPHSPLRYRALIIEENKLSRASAAARRKLWIELKSRYRLDAADPLFEAFWT